MIIALGQNAKIITVDSTANVDQERDPRTKINRSSTVEILKPGTTLDQDLQKLRSWLGQYRKKSRTGSPIPG